jgi:hypothetical protein
MLKSDHKLSAIAAGIAAIFAPQAHAASAGQVDFATAGVSAIGVNGQSRPLAKGAEIAPGELIDTGNGRAQVRFSDGGYVSLAPQTQFRLETYGYDKDDAKKNSIVMNLLRGGFRTITGLIGKTNREGYKLKTATATVGIRGTEFSITGFPDGSILFHTADGAIDVSNLGGSTTLTGGQSAYVGNQNSAPTPTNNTPFLPPPALTYSQTQIAPPANPVQGSNPTPVILTGTTNGPWITANQRYGINAPQNGYGGLMTTFTLSPTGHLTSYGYAGGYNGTYNASLGSATVQSYGNDGVMAWGRWIGGPVSDPNTGNATYPGNDPLHYVVGLPVTNLPTTGSATYNMYGGTPPSCSGFACGAISVGSSLMVNFASYTGSYTLAVANSADGANISGTGTLYFDNTHVNFNGYASMNGTGIANGYGTSYIYGFLAGPAASNAGAAYNVYYTSNSPQNSNYQSTQLTGVAVYKR